MARWATGDRGGAAAFATTPEATAALFAVAPRGAPTALLCAEAPPGSTPPPTDAGPSVACTYALAEGGLATLVVVSSAARGAAVVASTVS